MNFCVPVFYVFFLVINILAAKSNVSNVNDNADAFCPGIDDKDITSRFTVGQNGDQQLTKLVSSICLLTEVCGLRSDPAGCAIKESGANWQLHGVSNHNDLFCAAQCVTCAGSVNQQSYQLTGQNNDGQKQRMIQVKDGFCFLQATQALKDGKDMCYIQEAGGYWELYGQSNQNGFSCAARCQLSEDFTITDETKLTGSGSYSFYLTKPPSFCFLTSARALYDGSNRCKLEIENRDSKPFAWKFSKNSNQDDFECGARCVQVAGQYTEVDTSWRFIQNSYGGGISLDIAWGSTRSNGQSITNKWGHAFTVAIEASAKFLGSGGSVTLSSTTSQELAKSVSSEITHSMTKTLGASCDAEKNMYVSLYQYVLNGELKNNLGVDEVYSTFTRCHYSEHAKVPEPECPPEYCNDPLCQRKNCDPF